MEQQFEIIKSHLENHDNLLNESKLKIIQNDLLVYARKNKDFFIRKVQAIKPGQESVLFEIYEALSQEPEIWVDFIVSEFNRIKHLTENTKKKEQKLISDSLMALTFFAQQDFNGVNRLKTALKSGLHSKSKNIVIICLDLLSDIYISNKLKHADCKRIIEKFQNSLTIEIGQFAKELIKEIDNPSKNKDNSPSKNEDSNLKKILSIFTPSYASIVFFCGFVLSIKAIVLFQHTFVPFVSIVAIAIIVGLLSVAIHYFKVQDKTNVLGIALGYGLIAAFLFLFLNFNFQQSESINEILKISRKGEYPGKYPGRRGKIYIEFVRKGQTKKIDYYRSEKEKVENSNFIKIKTAMGLFGFEIITEKELKE
jgi:hypothetical protein